MLASDADWLARAWQSDDGLPNDTVTGVAQTADGFLWVATANHLARFDGVAFESFPAHDLGLRPLETITALARAHDDALWLGSSRGTVIRLKSGFVQVFTNAPRHFIRSLTEDGQGAVWLTDVRGGVSRINNGTVKEFGPAEGWTLADCSLTADEAGRIWFARAGQLGIVEDDQFKMLKRIDGDSTVRIAGCRNGGVWLDGHSRLYRYDRQRGLTSYGDIPERPGAAAPTAILEDRDGAVWIGTSGNGLFRFNGNGFENIPLSHHDVRTLTQDREGFIWAGMNGGGLDRIGPRVAQVEGTVAGGPFEMINSVCEDAAGNIWAATRDGSLICRVNDEWRMVSTNADWPGGQATCVTADPKGDVWIGTKNRAIYRWHDGHFDGGLGVSGGLRSSEAITLGLLGSRNGDVWAAQSTAHALLRLRDGRVARFPLSTNFGVIMSMAEDQNGAVWIGSTRGGLLKITGDEMSDQTSLISGLHAGIRCLYTSKDAVWIAFAQGGIGRLQGNHFVRIGTKQGLYDDSVSQIVADNEGWLWFGSDHGIFKVRETELAAVADGKRAQINPVHYGPNEGLKSLEAVFAYSPNVLRSRDGRLWMPMRNGLVVVKPGMDRDQPAPPAARLQRVTVDDQVCAWYGGVLPVQNMLDLGMSQPALHLAPSYRRLDFDFAALSFGAPENIRFRYRLDGFDNRWIEAGGRRSATYSRLPAGHYRFEVEACNADGVWGAAPATLAFSVAPFVWQTWWFRLATGLLFAGALVGLGRYISFRRLRAQLRELEQKAALDKERARIARDIHDDLGGSLTQAILLLKRAAKNNHDAEKMRELLRQVSSEVKEVIQSLDEIVWAANPSNDTLPHFIDYVGQFATDFLQAAEIRCRLDFPDDPPSWLLAPEIRHNLFLVLKESLTNVVRHAHAREVRIRLALTAESLEMAVQDDGIGFDGRAREASADGLVNIHRRMANIGGTCTIDSLPGSGTTISIALPVITLKPMAQ